MNLMFSSVLRRTLRSSLISSILYIECRSISSLSSSSSSFSPFWDIHCHRNTSKLLSLVPFRLASTAKRMQADDNLKKVIDSEIQCVQESDVKQVPPVPDEFPYEIIDKSGDQVIILKREFNGETIQIRVNLSMEEPEDSGDESDDPKINAPVLCLLVTVSKGGGPFLEFNCIVDNKMFVIDSITTKKPYVSADQIPYEGPAFLDLDEKLRDAFYSYLEERGINSNFAIFLCDYMTNKEEREYMDWLKNMKKFISN